MTVSFRYQVDITYKKKMQQPERESVVLRNKRKLAGVDVESIPSALDAAKRTKLAIDQKKAERDATERAREDEMGKKSAQQARDILLAFPEAQKAAIADGKTSWDVDCIDRWAVDTQLIANLVRLHLSDRRHDYIVDIHDRYDDKKGYNVDFISISWSVSISIVIF